MNLHRVDILECGYVVDAMWKPVVLHEQLEKPVAAIDGTPAEGCAIERRWSHPRPKWVQRSVGGRVVFVETSRLL